MDVSATNRDWDDFQLQPLFPTVQTDDTQPFPGLSVIESSESNEAPKAAPCSSDASYQSEESRARKTRSKVRLRTDDAAIQSGIKKRQRKIRVIKEAQEKFPIPDTLTDYRRKCARQGITPDKNRLEQIRRGFKKQLSEYYAERTRALEIAVEELTEKNRKLEEENQRLRAGIR
jgi:hypothetical protein